MLNGSAVHKTSSRQTFTDILKFYSDLDLEQSNSFFFFFPTRLSRLKYHKTKFWQKDEDLESYSRNSHILKSPCCDLDLEDSKQMFPPDTLAHNNASSYHIWQQNVRWFRRYLPDKHIDILSLCCDPDIVVIPPCNEVMRGWGEGILESLHPWVHLFVYLAVMMFHQIKAKIMMYHQIKAKLVLFLLSRHQALWQYNDHHSSSSKSNDYLLKRKKETCHHADTIYC